MSILSYRNCSIRLSETTAILYDSIKSEIVTLSLVSENSQQNLKAVKKFIDKEREIELN